MLSQFQASYQRMEQSLQRLTDSIAAYNPSTAAADELNAADEALSDNLEQLVKHQQNVIRIAELRRITQENDEKLRTHIRQLAELRKEISTVPSIDTTTSGREVGVDELLSYAKFISPTTVPPTFRKQDVTLKPTNVEPTDAQITNGIATPPIGAQEVDNPPYVKAENIAVQSLDPGHKAWLDPLANLPFEPWPSHDIIQMSALADIQRMVESGRDPASVLSPEEQAEADKRRQEDEENERLEEQERERRRMSMFDTGRRRTTFEQEDVFNPDD
ncbi:hypothetical protein LTR36_008652 [Oleoguttula mirabilis]|uniref:Mediator of RNA polymerase II transcription subunit 4 n=1 Tax=Oleoguttula mirabilis TaxID=1507867 RepID=A0AAV9JWA9_9PEZI|nr:hypothetical protein LTR36_008652 [Oleoguttula mirabilis]